MSIPTSENGGVSASQSTDRFAINWVLSGALSFLQMTQDFMNFELTLCQYGILLEELFSGLCEHLGVWSFDDNGQLSEERGDEY